MPDVIGEVSEGWVGVRYRISSDIFVEQQFLTEEKVAEYQPSHEQQSYCDSQDNAERKNIGRVIELRLRSGCASHAFAFVVVHLWQITATELQCEVLSKRTFP